MLFPFPFLDLFLTSSSVARRHILPNQGDHDKLQYLAPEPLDVAAPVPPPKSVLPGPSKPRYPHDEIADVVAALRWI